MWLRPGIAQDLIERARSFRAQSPSASQAWPQGADVNPFPSGLPYSAVPSAPTQPLPAVRPVTWPGTPVDSYTPAGSPARPGVSVWDPNRTSVQAAQTAASSTNSMPTLPPAPSSMPIVAPAPASMPTLLPAPISGAAQLLPPSVAAPSYGPSANNVTPANYSPAEMQNMQVLPGPPKEMADARVVAKV